MEKYTKYFGEPTNIDRKNYTYACPLCVADGGDGGADNLKIKIEGGLITCFKSAVHTKELRKEYKYLRPITKINSERIVLAFQEDKIAANIKYLNQCRKHLVDDYNNLIWHRGLKVSVLRELKVGIDPEKQCWVFPIWHHPSGKLIGFEYRDIQMLPRKEGGSVWREEGSFGCLAQINPKPPRVDNIIIMEGFIDAYCFYHYLQAYPKIIRHWILTPSCGVATTATHINTLKTKTGFTLLVDNDKAGEECRTEVQEVSKWAFHNLRLDKKFKDFGDYYKSLPENAFLKGIII